MNTTTVERIATFEEQQKYAQSTNASLLFFVATATKKEGMPHGNPSPIKLL
jgi:hypothetical protein